MSWTHKFENIKDRDEEVYFAYTYPFSYAESMIKTQKLLNKYESSSEVYIHREVLFHSLEGREIELITLSSFKGITTQKEEMFDGKGLLPFNTS